MRADVPKLAAPTLLIAMPQVLDPFFARTVVLLVHHDEGGSLGYIVNRMTDVAVKDVCDGLGIVWKGDPARLVHFGWSNRGRAVPGDTLTCTGRVTGKRVEGDRHLVDLEVVETNQRGEVCAPGKATVTLPGPRSSR